jgi:hypothetical protein
MAEILERKYLALNVRFNFLYNLYMESYSTQQMFGEI